MGYIFVLLSSLFGAAKGYAGKKSSYALSDFPAMLYFSMLRTIICAILGLLIWLMLGTFTLPSAVALTICLFSGISMSGFLISWVAAVKSGAYVRLDVFCQMGMVIPCIFAAPILKEETTVFQYIALGFLIIAVFLLSNNKSANTQMQFKEYLLLLFVWIFSGTNSLCVKLYSSTGGTDTVFYNLVTFFVSAISLAITFLFSAKKQKIPSLPKKVYTTYLPVMAICLFLNILFTVLSAQNLPSIVLFPLQTALGLFLSCIMAVFMFKEKLTKTNILGIIIAITSLCVINFM